MKVGAALLCKFERCFRVRRLVKAKSPPTTTLAEVDYKFDKHGELSIR